MMTDKSNSLLSGALNPKAQEMREEARKLADEAYRIFPDEIEPMEGHPLGKIIVDRGNLRFAFISGVNFVAALRGPLAREDAARVIDPKAFDPDYETRHRHCSPFNIDVVQNLALVKADAILALTPTLRGERVQAGGGQGAVREALKAACLRLQLFLDTFGDVGDCVTAADINDWIDIASLPADNRGEPIATAPQDGSAILAFNSRHPGHSPVVVRWDASDPADLHWCDDATASGEALYYNPNYFDFWMPVPKFSVTPPVLAKGSE